jgi:putative transferase (TIGR04331 family)
LLSMVKRFLITTALEETWRDDEPVLFLGEWCRRYSRKKHWEKMNAEVLPYHWDDRTKLYADYQHLCGFYERLLVDLSGQLNQIHKVDHSLDYWRILIGPWLGIFVPILFDRWSSIKFAGSQYDLSGTVVLTGQEGTLIPNDIADFMRLFVGDEWNHQLYGAILKEFASVNCVNQEWLGRDSKLKKASANGWKQKLKRTLLDCYSRAASLWRDDRDAFFQNTYLSPLDEIRLRRRLRELPQIWPTVDAVQIAANKDQRKWVVTGESRSDFEACARNLIPQQIPTVYLEGYGRLMEQVMDLPWPGKPKFILTCSSHLGNDVFKSWAAEKKECGQPLVIGQHGGLYGIASWVFNEDHELTVSDCYLSWGWSEPGQTKVKPVGMLRRKLLKVSYAEQRGALLVTTKTPRYGYPIASSMIAGQYTAYLNDQFTFVECLPANICNKLIVRLNYLDYGEDELSRWRDRFPNLHLDNGQSNINDLISQSKVYISTYNATSFLESFSLNMPTVIYWDPDHWGLRDSAVPYFEELKRVKIFHETPDSAAQHVADIWDDVDSWWASPVVKQVRKYFAERYCHTENMLDRLEATLREVVAVPKHPSPLLPGEKVSSDI